MTQNSRITVAIPCHNEEKTIASVIKDFQDHLPGCAVIVFDNLSSDRSAELARAAVAHVTPVFQKGKGHVMRAIFDTIPYGIVLVVDGDGTYRAVDAEKLIALVEQGADMAVGSRITPENTGAHAALNRIGTQIIVKLINLIFGTRLTDVLSGYRVFNRKFIDSVPLLTSGFETETEMTIQALEEGLIIKETPVGYDPRPQDSPSKLRPLPDGWRIILTIAMLLRDHYPLRLYGLLACLCWAAAFILNAADPLTRWFLTFLGVIFWGIALILSAVNTRLRELKQLLLRKRTNDTTTH